MEDQQELLLVLWIRKAPRWLHKFSYWQSRLISVVMCVTRSNRRTLEASQLVWQDVHTWWIQGALPQAARFVMSWMSWVGSMGIETNASIRTRCFRSTHLTFGKKFWSCNVYKTLGLIVNIIQNPIIQEIFYLHQTSDLILGTKY